MAAVACQATTATDGAAPGTKPPPAERPLDDPGPAVTAPVPASVPGPAEPAAEAVTAAAELLAESAATDPGMPEIDHLALSGDLRVGWVLVDALAVAPADRQADLVRGLATLTGQPLPAGEAPALFYGDLLLRWEVPAPPGYPEDKVRLLAPAGEGPGTLDPALPIDWRHVTRSGAGPDAGPALDGPEVGPAEEAGGWLGDDEEVVAVEVGGEARAYPTRVLAAHEVVNDLVGGTPIAVVHCGACGATVAFARDADRDGRLLTPDGTPLELATTGLVERGAPLLADRGSDLVVRSLAAEAVGPGGVWALSALPVRTTTWGAWRAAFPATTVVSEGAGVGRVYLAPDPAAASRSWPVGATDDRRPAAEVVLGVPDGPAAFPVAEAVARLRAGEVVEHAGVRLVLDGGGLAALSTTGSPLASHQATWLTWTAFHPGTALWAP